MRKRAANPIQVMVREFLTIVDLLALLNDPIFYGVRAPRGDGKLVAVIPGMFGSDSYLQPLNSWLRFLESAK
jgi:hypothetical protein